MIGFLIKKNFFDTWDNLFKIGLINIGFILSLAIPIFIPTLLIETPWMGIAVLILGILWLIIYLSAAAYSLTAISDYGSFGFADFFRNLKLSWKTGLVMGMFFILFYLLITLVIPFYLSMGNLVGLMFAAFVFWILVIAVLALQFFFSFRARFDDGIVKSIKKCFIVFFDNPWFCIFSFLHLIFQLFLSMFLAFIFPGPSGVLLFLDQGLRLRLLKYDWLEENPDANRKQIPWDSILIEERDRTGTRSLRNFIFPWKD